MGSFRALSVMLALVVVGLFAGTQLRSIREPFGAALGPEPSPSMSAPAPGPDAAWYAQTNGVSLEEAARRLGLQEEIGKLNAALETGEVATFAGLWIEHTPRYRVVARFTRDGARTLARYVTGTALAPIVEPRSASYTLVQLQQDVGALGAALAPLSFTASVNVQENRVDIQVDSREEVEAHLRARGLTLPRTAHLVPMGTGRSLDCGDAAGEQYGIFFPRHCTKPWQPVPAALIRAALTLRDGCLWLGEDLAIWPPGWVPVKVDGRIEIRDADGVKRGAVGETMALGGGEYSDPQHIADVIGREPPPPCRGQRAWFVGSHVGP